MAERTRQESREAFILHGYPYRETSLLLETFTCAFGRVSMVARGARSPRSPLRGVLLAFRSEEHTSELQSPVHIVCRLLREKKKVPHSIGRCARETRQMAARVIHWSYT